MHTEQQTTRELVHNSLILEHELTRLEEQLCQYTGAGSCVAVPNAGAGLRLALQAAGIRPGDRVLCPTYGQYAAVQAIYRVGAHPLFVDINPNNFNLDPFCLESVVGRCVRSKEILPKALITTDVFGLPCNYPVLEEICARFDIVLIEDMTHSFGASLEGRKTGNFGRFAVASFQDTKLLGGVGEDAVVFCHTQEDEINLRRLRGGQMQQVFQAVCRDGDPEIESIQLTLLREQLRSFDQELERRQAVARRYRSLLSDQIRVQQTGLGFSSAYTQFVVALENKEMRSFVMNRLMEEHVPCSVYCPIPLHLKTDEGCLGRIVLLNAQAASQRLLALPMNPYLSNNVLEFICSHLMQAIRDFKERAAQQEDDGDY